MVNTILEVLWEANISLAVLAIVYLAFLRRLTHFSWNRMFLLMAPVVSLLIAVINIEVEEVVAIISQSSASLSDLFPHEALVEMEEETIGETSWFNGLLTQVPFVLVLVALLGAVASGVQLLWQLLRLRSELMKNSEFLREQGVYLNNRFKTAFAFGRRIYLPEAFLELPQTELQKVIAHEQAHLDLRHGLDNVLMTILKPLFWYNPIFWFIHRELRLVHEFQADEACNQNECESDYSTLLLKLSAPGLTNSLVHPFSKNLIKKRVTKLNQLKSPIMKKVLFLITVPVVGMLFYAFSVQYVTKTVVTNEPSSEVKPFILPIEAGAITKISPFGLRSDPLNESRKFHSGIDFVAQKGVPVIAAGSGVVTKVEHSMEGYGMHLEITHENGLVSRYAHLDQFAVEQGQRVQQGSLIAYNGNTGRSTGPHLHFEVLRNDSTLDPEMFLEVPEISVNEDRLKVNKDELVIIIDAAHGGEDLGNHDYGISEKELALEYAVALREKLQDKNYTVKMVRTSDENVTLKERTDMSTGEVEALLISIHFNAADSSDAHGVEIYVPQDQDIRREKSSRYACILDNLIEQQGIDTRGIKSAPYWIVNKSECPAVLVELGFLSSAQDRENLRSADHKAKLVEALNGN
ncbi:MAG: N-acetylmuramoyl-L-alanine amidase [Flavobacteriales bacterium]